MRLTFLSIIAFCYAMNAGQTTELRTVSLFSPIDPKTFVDAMKGGNNDQLDINVLNGDADVLAGDADIVSKAIMPPKDVKRRNIVTINADTLNSVLAANQADTNIVPVVSMDLFTDVHLNMVANRIARTEHGSISISGPIQNIEGASAILIKNGNTLTGTIRTPTGIFKIQPTSDTTLSSLDLLTSLSPQMMTSSSVIDELDKVFPSESDPGAPVNAPELPNDLDIDLSKGDDPTRPDPAPTVKVIVFYTQSALNAIGSQNQVNSLLDEIKVGFDDSLADASIRLVVSLVDGGVVPYPESGNIETDRDRLQRKNDGFMDNVFSARDSANAQVVALLINSGGIYCGIAFIPEDLTLDYSDYGFMVVDRSCAVDNLSFMHEFGHILGARHDQYVDATEGKPIPGNHGVIFKCGDAFCRDIMAYNNYCTTVLHTSCQRLPVWSGRVWQPGNTLLGNNQFETNNQRALRLFGPIIAHYRN